MPDSGSDRVRWTLEHNGKEVEINNPVARVLVVAGIMLAAWVGAVIAVVMTVLGGVIGVLVHPLLRIAGRKGFVQLRHGYVGVKLDRRGFQKR